MKNEKPLSDLPENAQLPENGTENKEKTESPDPVKKDDSLEVKATDEDNEEEIDVVVTEKSAPTSTADEVASEKAQKDESTKEAKKKKKNVVEMEAEVEPGTIHTSPGSRLTEVTTTEEHKEEETPVAPKKETKAAAAAIEEVGEKQKSEKVAGAAKEEHVAGESISGPKDAEDSTNQEVGEEKTESTDHQEDEEDHEEIDYSTFSKEQLIEAVTELAKSEKVIKAYRESSKIAPFFLQIRRQEKENAMRAFLDSGGDASDFELFHDEQNDLFDANMRLIRDRRSQYLKNREAQQDKNLEMKLIVLEKLRQFVDSEETNISFNEFKAIQEEWKSIGQVPQAHTRTLWPNYHALLDRFYDNRSIYFELKELDRKKNLESKIELCEKAEKLQDMEVLKDAIKELNELHEEFKHLGPVPKADQEAVWTRFKAASDAVYMRRREYVEELKKTLDINLEKKLVFCEKIEEYTSFDSDRIKEWNTKTKEILELQKQWEAIGGLPRAKAKEINKRFWGSFKTFFTNKNTFFHKLDGQREDNLIKKRELIEKAKTLSTSTDWEKTAEEFKKLQNNWREIGPIPQKLRDSVYKEFKSYCDHFFNEKRGNVASLESDYAENLVKKEALCEEIEKLAGTEEGTKKKLQELEKQYNDLGFVPKNAVKSIRNKFKSAVDKYISKIKGLSEDEKEQLVLQDEIRHLTEGPNSDQRLARKEYGLRREIGQLENDISLWKNNLEFFASSKTADKLKVEFNGKIEKASNELSHLKKQLRMIRQSQ